ncbi:MAG: CopG family ribbon-helix-helix protein [Candidatus Altiarchaeia archaeon]
MSVISVSLTEETIEELDKIVGSGGYRGRSDAVNAAINLLSRETDQYPKEGKMSGILILIHNEKYEAAFSEARHKFEGLIKTMVHNQIGRRKCLELFILEGECKEVEALIKACRKSGRADYLKLITTC